MFMRQSQAWSTIVPIDRISRLAQLVERITCNDEVSRSSRLMGTSQYMSQSFLPRTVHTSHCYTIRNSGKGILKDNACGLIL